MDKNLVETRKITTEEAKQCATEKIHIIGKIQPHGFQLVADPVTLKVVQYSSNFLPLLNAHLETPFSSAKAILDSKLESWVCFAKENFMNGLSAKRTTKLEIHKTSIIAADHWECLAHLANGWVSLEFLPTSHEYFDSNHAINHMDNMIDLLNSADCQQSLFNVITHQLQSYTKYDRIMMYRFLPDWSGEVVAEAVSPREEIKYLGMRFPAEDIPKQARDLYKKNKIRFLANVDEEAAILIPELLPDNEALDQSYSLLRDMSDMHKSYLKNMGVKASLSMSIKRDDNLWGMLVLHHNEAKVPPHHIFAQLKTTCELFVEVFSSYLKPISNIENLNNIMQIRHCVDNVFNTTIQEKSSDNILENIIKKIFLAVDYDYLGVILGKQCYVAEQDKVSSFSEGTITSICSLFSKTNALSIRSHQIKKDYKKIKGLEEMDGIYIIRSNILSEFYIFLGRKGAVEKINWAGKPNTVDIVIKNNQRYLEPRSSFALWQQTVKHQCEIWEEKDLNILESIFDRFKDFVALKKNEILISELEKNAHYDNLTGLANRNYLKCFINIIDKSKYKYISLLFIDLDNFKDVNDFMGHETGDRILLAVSKRLKKCIRPNDIAVRLGGDEFVVVLVHHRKPSNSSLNEIAKQLLQDIGKPLSDGEHSLVVTPSIGVVCEKTQSMDFIEVLKRADIAMYSAKNKGKNQFHFFNQKDQEFFNKKAILTMDLRDYIATENIEVFYQPQCNFNKEIIGVEALARWNHSKFGYISPDFFIEIAEKNNLIYELGLNIIKKVCSHYSIWIAYGCLACFNRLSINISPSQLIENNFEEDLIKIINYYEISPKNICLEITESIFIKNYQDSVKKLSSLRKKGFYISLDDFGTGFSSLNSLWRLPIDEVKIDKSFIDNINIDEGLFTMVESLILLCKKLDLNVVAEGIENNIEFNLLKGLGCDICQGFFYSRPICEMEFKEHFIYEK